MENNFRYVLDPSTKKFVCAGCSKKRFVRYIDQLTKEYLPDQYGRCDREVNCGYYLNPYTDGYSRNHNGEESTYHWTPPPPEPPKPPSYINFEILKASRKDYEHNNFVKWLRLLFDEATVNNMIARYHIGTSKHWPGAVVFWQIDQDWKIRTSKIMGYNPTTGRRIKEPELQITFVHKAMRLENFNLKQCYFGEHLLKLETEKPIGLVESEKTAVVASEYLPEFIWLAVGSLTNINVEKCRPLAGRRVFLFPDLGGYDKWSQKATELQKAMPGTQFIVSDLLEQGSSEADRREGLDLCDYLVKLDLQSFTSGNTATIEDKPEPDKVESLKSEKSEKSEALKTNYFSQADSLDFDNDNKPASNVTTSTTERELPKPIKTGTWNLSQIETYFQNITLPDYPIQLNRWTTITDVPKFVESHLSEAKAHNGNIYFKSGYESLIELRNILTLTQSDRVN